MRIFFITTLVLFNFLFLAHAQNKNVYKSAADELITIRSIAVLPVFDNLQGIYARPVEDFLVSNLKKNHRWDYSESQTSGPILTPDELEENPSAAQQIANGISADAFLVSSVIKGPSGISIKLDLFLKADQKLIAQESVSDLQIFDVTNIKKKSQELFDKIAKKIPYSGIILSRQGTRVTVNLGRQDGIENGQILSVIQIIKLNRHPKFNFLVSSEKEIIGKIKLLKVDDALSFARIVTEKESGAIQVGAKVAGLDSVVYSNTNSLSDNANSPDSLETQPDGAVTYGSHPTAWLPKEKPTFGMVGARFGIGQFTENTKGSSSLDAKAAVYPFIVVDAEIWLTPQWSMHTQIRQGIISTNNPVSGGSPDTLSHSLSYYDFLFGYNLRLTSAANSPKVEALFGYSTYRLYVDQSTPAGLTTKAYSGLKLGVAGSYPVADNSPYSVGANLFFSFNPRLNETPTSSGSADNTVNNFGFFVDKTLGINLKARAALDFELYASDFSGGTFTSSSQKHTSVSAGIYYLF